MIEITKVFRIEAAHFLPYHKGKCRNPHGHSWKCEVTISGKVREDGMIMDFADLKTLLEQQIVTPYDHTVLNMTLIQNPTAENIATMFGEKINRAMINAHPPYECFVSRVRVWETETSCATWINIGHIIKSNP